MLEERTVLAVTEVTRSGHQLDCNHWAAGCLTGLPQYELGLGASLQGTIKHYRRHCWGQWGGVGRGPFLDYIPHVAKAEQGALRFPTQVGASFFSSGKVCHADCQVVSRVDNALMRGYSLQLGLVLIL